MAKLANRHTKDRPNATRIRSVIIVLLTVQTIAIGLKVVDERARAHDALQANVELQTKTASERLSGQIETALQTLKLGQRMRLGSSATAREYDQLELVTGLTSAMAAPQGSRLKESATRAATMRDAEHAASITSTGEPFVLAPSNSSNRQIALLKPAPFKLQPEGQAVTLVPMDGANELLALNGGIRACAPVRQSDFAVCTQATPPVFTTVQMLDVLAYFMLLAGPTLAIFGLLSLLSRRTAEADAIVSDATRTGRALQTVLHETKSGFWTWNPSDDHIWLSSEAATILGLSEAGDYLLSDLETLVHPKDVPALRQGFTDFLINTEVDKTLYLPDQDRWIDLRASADSATQMANGVIIDITEKREALARTKRAEQRLRTALEGFSGPFALWDRSGRLVFWNKAYGQVFNLQDDLRVGLTHKTVRLALETRVRDRYPVEGEANTEILKAQDDHWYKMVERKTSGQTVITMGLDVTSDVTNQNELKRQQKNLRKFALELERSEGHAGELARKLNEEKIRAEESANSKSAFLANMSHELRTPLNAIHGFSEILIGELYGPLGSPKYKEYCEDILASGQHLLDLIDDILDMAKIDAGKMTVDLLRLDMVDPIDAAIRIVRRKAEDKGLRLDLVVADDLPKVDADHRAIRQMILNLVSNAIKFTDQGGEIRVTVRQVDDHVRVSVRDTGIGIPEAALPRLAQPFEQVRETRDRNYEGTGLGLALTKSFAEMQGGTFTITSKEGVGTEVAFSLPIADDAAGRSVA